MQFDLPDSWTSETMRHMVSIKHGYAFKGEHFVDGPTEDVLVTPGNFAIGGGFQGQKLKHYDGPIDPEYVLAPGDLIVTMTDLSKKSDTLGYSAIVPHSSQYRFLHNQRVGLVELHPDSPLDAGFLNWFMRSPRYRARVLATSSGSTVRHTSPSRILNIEVPLPPLNEQRRIATVLGALESKIEANHRMNETLEALVQSLFKQRFVDFYGHDNLVDSGTTLGEIPSGWKAETLGRVSTTSRTSVQPSDVHEDTAYIGLGDMPEGSIALTQWGTAADVSSGKSTFEQGDFLFGKLRPYFKKVGVAPVDGICSSDILVVRPRRPEWYSYVLGILTYDPFIDFCTATATGTRMPRAKWSTMAGYALALPPADVADEFDQRVKPILDRIQANVFQSRTLAELRDALLPELVSGRLRVPEGTV